MDFERLREFHLIIALEIKYKHKYYNLQAKIYLSSKKKN